MNPRRSTGIQVNWVWVVVAPAMNILLIAILFLWMKPVVVPASGLSLELPRAVTQAPWRQKGVVITVTAAGDLFFETEPVTGEMLERKLAALDRRDRAVLIKADRRAAIGVLASVWDACRRQRLERVSLATDR